VRIFITGATGFVGTHLVDRLDRDGHESVCLVRETSRTATLETKRATPITGDVEDFGSLSRAMPGCDCVIHLANVYSFWQPDPSIYFRVNLDGTRNVMQAAIEVGVPKVVHVSTNLIWGRPTGRLIDEKTKPGPNRFSLYAESKYQADRVAWRFHRDHGLPLAVLHPGGILGPGDDKFTGALFRKLINRQLPARMLDSASLAYVHVADVVEAIAVAAERADVAGERYILVGGHLTMGELYDTVCEIAGVAPPRLRVPDFVVPPTAFALTAIANLVQRPPLWGLSTDAVRTAAAGTACDGAKAVRELGITYTPIRTALEQTVAWIRRAH
jgi:dihydroflavonol-4-reductase